VIWNGQCHIAEAKVMDSGLAAVRRPGMTVTELSGGNRTLG
jgi:hypothetical protein